ncbi:MAG: 4Fe-4S binding protein [Cyanobacteria bacterium SID2]|nr:4Fe-4S binding protein [Cyanobacteria bacterium SID2]
MIASERVTWLKTNTRLSELSDVTLAEFAATIEVRTVAANTRLSNTDALPDGIYIIYEGRVYCDRPTAKFCSTPGAILYLQDVLLDRPVSGVLTTLTDTQLWWISRQRFRELLERHPELAQILSRQLAAALDRVSTELAYERERQAALRPYLVPRIRRGIIGNSRYAVRLRSQIEQAARDRQSVLIFGEPGLEKDNVAALVHYSSRWRREPMVKLTSSLLQTSGVDLFGRSNGKPGILEWVGTGTVVLNNVQDLPDELRPKISRLLETRTYIPVNRNGDPPLEPRFCDARVVLISERVLPELEPFVAHTIKVPPLRVRKADIKAKVDYYLRLCCQARGLPKPTVTPEAIRRLQSYDFPNNLRELDSLVKRAVTQASGASELTEELFWSKDNKKTKFRFNLFKAYPQLRQFLRSNFWPDGLNYGVTSWVFALVVIVLFVGPQTRDRNFALNLFWAWWWPLVLVGFPFVGRLWCSVCPFMIYGEIAQKLSLKLFPRSLKRWPRETAEQWGGWFLFGLFALIFLWEELWKLENTAYLSSCLLLLITAGAIIFSLIFERRFWCRYLCPIGGMNGLFAKLSMTELRAQTGICSAECTTYQCYKGGPEKGEGQETDGCPLYSHPAQLQDNRDCVLCMTCLKACPHRSVEFNWRLPGIELWTTHVPRSYEVALLFLLLSGVFLHRLPELQETLQWSFDLDRFLPHLELSLLVLLAPVLVPVFGYLTIYGIHRVWKTPKPRSFVELSYGYLPLVLGGNLAHYLTLGLGEAGQILPTIWETFGSSGANLPIWAANSAVIAFLQGTTLILATIVSIVLTQKIAKQPFWTLLPQHLTSLSISFAFWTIVL